MTKQHTPQTPDAHEKPDRRTAVARTGALLIIASMLLVGTGPAAAMTNQGFPTCLEDDDCLGGIGGVDDPTDDMLSFDTCLPRDCEEIIGDAPVGILSIIPNPSGVSSEGLNDLLPELFGAGQDCLGQTFVTSVDGNVEHMNEYRPWGSDGWTDEWGNNHYTVIHACVSTDSHDGKREVYWIFEQTNNAGSGYDVSNDGNNYPAQEFTLRDASQTSSYFAAATHDISTLRGCRPFDFSLAIEGTGIGLGGEYCEQETERKYYSGDRVSWESTVSWGQDSSTFYYGVAQAVSDDVSEAAVTWEYTNWFRDTGNCFWVCHYGGTGAHTIVLDLDSGALSVPEF